MRRTFFTLALLALATAPALAAVAFATRSLHVRTGPGMTYAIVDTLDAGEQVTVDECADNWCHIKHYGPDGWVYGSYLSPGVAPDDPCDVDETTAFHRKFGLFYTPEAKYCREHSD